MIRIVVNRELCGAHGTCEREAPEVFRVVETADGYAGVELIDPATSDDPSGRVKTTESVPESSARDRRRVSAE